MASILHLVPYEVRVNAVDLSSGKPLSSLYYLRTGLQVTPVIGYGAVVAGSGDTATLLASFKTAYVANILPLLSAQYKSVDYVMRSLLGSGYSTPYQGITVGIGTVTTISTTTPHGLSSADLVSITEVTGTVAGINGVWPISVTGGNTYTIAYNSTGQVWSGGGKSQQASGALKLIYGSQEVLADSTVGSVSGDALPLFSNASVRRIGSTTGKSFQGRNSLAPIGESQQVDGAFTTSAKTAWATALNTLQGSTFNNGGTDASSGADYLINISKKIAFTQVSPFVTATPWTATVNAMLLRPNLGSLIRRKPKLGAPLA